MALYGSDALGLIGSRGERVLTRRWQVESVSVVAFVSFRPCLFPCSRSVSSCFRPFPHPLRTRRSRHCASSLDQGMTSSIYSVNVVRDALSCAGNYLHSYLILSTFTHTRISCPMPATTICFLLSLVSSRLLLLLPDLYNTPPVIATSALYAYVPLCTVVLPNTQCYCPRTVHCSITLSKWTLESTTWAEEM